MSFVPLKKTNKWWVVGIPKCFSEEKIALVVVSQDGFAMKKRCPVAFIIVSHCGKHLCCLCANITGWMVLTLHPANKAHS